jgi:hypothetical protein
MPKTFIVNYNIGLAASRSEIVKKNGKRETRHQVCLNS